MLKIIKQFLEKIITEKKAKELYLRYEDLEAEEIKKIEEKAKILEISKLMRENMLQRKEIEKLKEQIKELQKKLTKKYEKEEKEAIELQKRIKKMREVKIFLYSNPPIQVIAFDTNYPYISPDGNHCRFLCGFKLTHIPGLNEPFVYPLLSVNPLKKAKIPKNIYRLILPENNARMSRINEIIAEPDIIVYSLRYGTPINLNVKDYIIENSKSKNSIRFMLLFEKPISVMNYEKEFISPNGEVLKYLCGFELSNSRFNEPLVFPLLTNENIKNKIKHKHYTLYLKDSEITLSELFTIFLEREKIVKSILKNKPLKLSISSDGVFVKDYIGE